MLCYLELSRKNLITYELGGGKTWYIYDLDKNRSEVLWADRESFSVKIKEGSEINVSRSDLRELVWSQDGKGVAGSVRRNNETLVIVLIRMAAMPDC